MKKAYFILIAILFTSCNLDFEKKEEKKQSSNKADSLQIISKSEVINNELKQENNDDSSNDDSIRSRLPDWFSEAEILQKLNLKNGYELDYRMNPHYLEADFNGDGNNDIAIPIKQIKSGKIGFAIIHGETEEIFIIGAGTRIENDLSDDLNYIDVWSINNEKINGAGAEESTGSGPKGELIITYPSIKIEKTEAGGGLIYWKGNTYAYFHQSC